MEKTIFIFTMLGCPYCVDLKNTLIDLKIPYTELKIHENKPIWEQLVKQVGLRNLPTVFIKEGDTDMGPVYVSGRDFDSRDEIIELIKKNI